MKALVGKFWRDESGATAIEYGLIAAGISLAIIAVVNNIGTNLNSKFDSLNTAIKGVAATLNVKFANTARVINFSGTHGGPEKGDIPTVCALTAMCPGGTFNPASPEADIHPTKAGYAAMAAVTAVAYLSH